MAHMTISKASVTLALILCVCFMTVNVTCGNNKNSAIEDKGDLSVDEGMCLFNGETVILPPPTIDGLVLHLTYDQTLTLDQSSHGHHANGNEKRGPGYFLSQGYSGHYVGELNTVVPANNNIDNALADEFSVTFWIFINKFGTMMTDQCNIIAKGDKNEQPFFVGIDLPQRKLMVSVETSESSHSTVTSNAKLQNQRWTHVAITRSDKMIVLYVNGVLDAVRKTEKGKATASKSINIGRMPWQDYIGGGGNIDFYLDEFKLWKQVIEESWIEAEAGLSLGAGVDPHSIELGCIDCSIDKAVSSGTNDYHLGTTIEQYSFAFSAAKSMGWLQAGKRVWSDRASEEDSDEEGLGICCKNY